MSLEGLQPGRYQLLRAWGSGGMGEVYEAEDWSRCFRVQRCCVILFEDS